MTLRKLIVGAAVALATLATGPVKAADLDPALEDPVQDISAMPVSNVVFGSGWYARGDIAANPGLGLSKDYAYGGLTRFTTNDSINYTAGLGAGYKFLNYFRADAVVDWHEPVADAGEHGYNTYCGRVVCSSVQTGTLRAYDALANGYFDFGTWYRMTPYVGAGAGFGFGEQRGQAGWTSLSGKALTPSYHYDIFHTFAFAAMAGVAIDVFPHVKVDVNYRYLNLGTVGASHLEYNEARIGLRYMIDD